MSELTSGYLMDYTDDIASILDNVVNKDYTIATMKCQELLQAATDEKEAYNEYMSGQSFAYEHAKLQELELPF